MDQQIQDSLNNIEKKYGITILYAVESGSRVWGFESPDSDYDIRFIYIYPIKKYVALQEPSESITIFSEDRMLDFQGWEFRKALKHLRDGNPSILEWIHSPTVYRNYKNTTGYLENDNIKDTLIWLSERLPSLTDHLINHYAGMGKKNYYEHIEKKIDLVNCKKYLYVIRPLLTLEWFREERSDRNDNESETKIFINFIEQIDECEKIGIKAPYKEIKKLIDDKKTMVEMTNMNKIPVLDEWIKQVLEKKHEHPKIKHLDYIDFDMLFWNVMSMLTKVTDLAPID